MTDKPNDVRVSRELLERMRQRLIALNQIADFGPELFELLNRSSKPADQHGEPFAWAYIEQAECGAPYKPDLSVSRWSLMPDGYTEHPLYRHAQPATAKVVLPGLSDLREQYESWADANGYDITRNEHGDYAGIVEDSMWSGWQAKAEHWNIPDRIVIGQSIELDTKAIGWNACLDEVAKLNTPQ